MGEYFQKLAAPDVARADAAAVAARVRGWLQSEQIVVEELSDCVLGGPEPGHEPGLGWRKAVVSEHAPTEQNASGRVTLVFVVNGVEILDTPTVYWTNWATRDDPFETTCPRCGMRFSSGFADEHILPHVGAWLDGDDTLKVSRPHCAGAADLPAWRMDTLVLAYVGLAFWNWPPIAAQFIETLGELAGSQSSLSTGSFDG